jgi:hypothetical protein
MTGSSRPGPLIFVRVVLVARRQIHIEPLDRRGMPLLLPRRFRRNGAAPIARRGRIGSVRLHVSVSP